MKTVYWNRKTREWLRWDMFSGGSLAYILRIADVKPPKLVIRVCGL